MFQKTKKNIIYRIINCMIMGAILPTFCNLLCTMRIENLMMFSILLCSAALVLAIKFIRFYIILFGRDIPLPVQFRQYCKVVPVSILFPFKTGELFRMYCYGYHMNNYVESMICILFDRFVDTVALLTIIFGMQILFGMNSFIVLNLLVLFSICVFIAYYTFRPLYKFWNDFLISSTASERRLGALAFLKKCNTAYGSVDRLVKGKFLMLYVLSLLAWGIELGGLALVSAGNGGIKLQTQVYEYLTATLTGRYSAYMRSFSLVSIIILLMCYLIVQVCMVFKHQRERA